MIEEKYPISYNDEYHSLRLIPEGMPIFHTDEQTHVKVFNGRTTWKYFQLIPTSRPVINPPPFKANFISIPGGNGSIDASTALTNYPMYDDRTGSIEFKSMRDYGSPTGWVKTYELLLNYIHGRKFKVVLFDDPDFYYEGRLSINSWKSDKDWSTITLDYRLDPFKYWVGSDEFNEYYCSNIEIVGKGFQDENYVHYASRAFDHSRLSEYGLSVYGNVGDYGFTMPVSPEIIIQALPYSDMSTYIPHKNSKKQTVGEPPSHNDYTFTVLKFKTPSHPSNPITATVIGTVRAVDEKIRLWAFLDEDFNVLSKAKVGAYGTKNVTAPENAKYLVVNSLMSVNYDVTTDSTLEESFTWVPRRYVPTGDEIVPSSQTPSCICFVQGTVKNDDFTKKASVSYKFEDTNQHSVNAYGIVFKNDETVIRVHAEKNQRFRFSYKLKRGLL